MRRRDFTVGLGWLLAGAPYGARGEGYPSRPITIIVGYVAGGATDTVARIAAERMKQALGQYLIVENVTGASGSLGTGRVAHATPDGYTLNIGDMSTHIFNGAIYDLPYDVRKDFEPVAMLPGNPSIIVANQSVRAKDLQEFINWIRSDSKKVTGATAGVGSTSHLSLARLETVIGAHIQLVPYRGAVPALQDVIAGHVDFTFGQVSNCLPAIRAGQLKAFAVTSKTRIPAAQDIPTVDEAGLPEFYISTWHGLWAPKGTPKEIVAKLNQAVVELLADPVMQSRFTEMGMELPSAEQQTPEALGYFQMVEIDRWWPIIRAANIRSQ